MGLINLDGISAAKLYAEVGADTSEAERKVDGFGKKIENSAKKMGQTGTLLSATVTAPLLGIAGAALNTAMGFEQNMNILQQVLGATASDMSGLQEQAIALGASTVFSAGEASDAMLELGKAGMNTEQIMASIGGVMDLAAAGGVSLAEAASLTAATLNAFHLEAGESVRVANLLAATANASAADISDLGAGMQQAGFAFSMANQPVDNLAASLAILTNVGLTGSDAGTALKNAFMRMMNPTKEALGVMNELGISFYDAAGNMLPLEDIIDNLNVATAGLTAEQRDQALATLFLSDGMKAFIPLMDAGKDGFLEMKDSVNQAGAATDVANARMGGLAGAVERVKGAVDTFLLKAAYPFLDSMSGVLVMVADGIERFSNLPQPVMNAALAFGAILAAAGPVIGILGAVLGAVTVLANPLFWIVAATAALAAAWSMDFGGIQAKTQQVMGVVGPYLTGLLTDVQNLAAGLPTLEQAWGALPGVLASVEPQIKGVASAFQLLWSVMSGQGAGSGQIAGWKSAIEDAFGGGAVDLVMRFVDTFRAGVGQVQMIWAQVVSFLTPTVGRIKESFAGLDEGLGTLGPKFSALGAAAIPALQSLGTIISWVAQLIGTTLVLAVSLFGNLFAAVIGNLPGILGIVVDQMTVMVTMLGTVLQGLIKLATSLIQGDWAGVWDGALTILKGFGQGMLGTLENLGGMIGYVFKILSDTVGGFLSDLGIDATDEIDAVEKTVRSFWDWLTGLSWGDIWSGMSDGFAGGVASLLDWEWPSPAELIAWTWPSLLTLYAWAWPKLTELTGWDWPSPTEILAWDWPGLPTWTWPSIPTPGWVDRLVGAIQNIDVNPFDNNATGSSFYQGGMTWVGERGPELVRLPRGSRIWSNQDSMAMAGSGGGIKVVMENVIIANDMDIHTAATKLGREINRRVRR